MTKKTLRVMMIGDVSGQSGMGALFLGLSSAKRQYNADFVILNGENAAGGFGITIEDYNNMKKAGVDVITSGNHIWQKDEIFPFLDRNDDILRPANYPEPCIGKGMTIKEVDGVSVAVINLQGRVEMMATDDPFRKAEALVRNARKTTPLIFVDFHAESTEEKEALSFFLDGSVTAVAGTHTHVQTRDEKILSKGTAYITDLGITGVLNKVIGSDPAKSIERQLTQLPIRSEVAEGKGRIQGIVVEADRISGKALSIERFTF